MKGVIFDLDGTILDSEPLHGEAIAAVLAPLGLRIEPAWYVGLPDEAAIDRAFRESGTPLSRDTLDRLLAEKSERLGEMLRQGRCRPFPGAADLVRAAAAHCGAAVCTAARRADAEPALRSAGLREILVGFVCAEDVARTKPDPEPYILAASQIGAHPHECVAIEDSVHGVASAVSAGMRVIALGHSVAREHLGEAHLYYPRIEQITVERMESLVRHGR